MKNQSIVILSSDDWGWKTSKYQLSTRFSRDNRVLFVSSIGFRAPTASRSDLTRIGAKLRKFLSGPRKVADNIWVLTPVVVPFGSGALVRWFNRFAFRLQYRLAVTWLRFDKPYLFVFSPNWAPYLPDIGRRKFIYYCVDEHASFKGVDAGRFRTWDRELTAGADHVFCSADRLFDAKKALNPRTHYMPHGVNWTLFSQALAKAAARGTDPVLRDLRRKGPVLLFFGHVSYDWVDTNLLRYVASQRPDWQLALVGRNSLAPDEFAGISTIHLLGERAYEDLPEACRHASIGIIPFVRSELTEACNPLKLYEYFAAGLPVVSTDIPEVRRYRDTALIAETPSGFVTACDKALQIDRAAYSPRVSALVRDHDWDRRVEHIYSLIAA